MSRMPLQRTHCILASKTTFRHLPVESLRENALPLGMPSPYRGTKLDQSIYPHELAQPLFAFGNSFRNRFLAVDFPLFPACDMGSKPVAMSHILNFEEYTVAWIAVLPIEADAALAMLDNQHDRQIEIVRCDDQIYIGGDINGHGVVIATLLERQNYGVGSAAALVIK